MGVYDSWMKRTNLHLDEKDYEELRRYAEKNGHTAAHLVRQAIRELLVKLRAGKVKRRGRSGE